MTTTTSSTSTSLSGIFAKFVAKFLVKWVKKTLGIGQADRRPALSSTPSEVTGRPERDRSRENFGSHTGSSGERAFEDPGTAQAIRGDDYGSHTGSSGERAFEDPGTAQAIQGDDYGAHRGTLTERPYLFQSPEERLATAVADLEQRVRALENANPQALREFGLNDKQVAQCQAGRVPSGHQLDRAPSSGVGETQPRQQNWVLSPITPDSQVLTNNFHNQVIDIRIGETRILSIPAGSSNVVLILGAAA